MRGERAGDVLERIARAGLSAPLRLTVAVARSCNLRCAHCYVEAEPSEGLAEPSAEGIRRLVSDFAALGGRELCLTGGEPLTRPDWSELLAYACRARGLELVRLQTNAVLLDAAAAEAISTLGCDRLRVQVSLEGAGPESHDRVRGAGNFAKALKALALLAERGLAGQIEVAFTEMRHNVGELPEVLELLEELGVGKVLSAAVTPHGRAAASPVALPPEPAQYRELLRRYQGDIRLRERCTGWADVAAFKWWEWRCCPSEPGCSLARHLYVGIDGRLYPCPLLHSPEFAVEGAWTRPLAESLSVGVPHWAALQRTSEGRAREIAECQDCVGKGHCGGGCMGRAHMASGILLAPEDRCELRKAVYGCCEQELDG